MHTGSRIFTPRGYAGVDSFAIGGQSNAVGAETVTAGNAEANNGRVFMLGQDYVYKPAYEPTHDPLGNVDAVTADVASAGHSAWLRMANSISTARTRDVLLVPCAHGSTILWDPTNEDRVESWVPTHPQLVTTARLYGHFRNRVRPLVSLKGVCWSGHETSAMSDFEGTKDLVSRYATDWTRLVQLIKSDFPGVPIFYVQLGHCGNGASAQNGIDRSKAQEIQRSLEASQTGGLAGTYMVTQFDLPLLDSVHLTAASQKIVGDRFARAIRAIVYGEAIAWTGPRLLFPNPVTMPTAAPTVITVQFDAQVSSGGGANYDNLFRVYSNGVEVGGVTATKVGAATIQLTAGTFATNGTLYITYGEVVRADFLGFTNHIVDVNGLPTPAFRQTVSLV
jgi:hypothetical protein